MTTETALPVRVSARAARRIAEILKSEPAAAMLRLAVTGGGCSGFQYNFALDETRVKMDEVSKVIWSGSVDDWHEGDHLANAAARAGLDPIALARTADDEAERLHAVIEESQVAQRAAGHYGVPMIAFNGEPFFGQDRFDQFKWRLEQQGLKRR